MKLVNGWKTENILLTFIHFISHTPIQQHNKGHFTFSLKIVDQINIK